MSKLKISKAVSVGPTCKRKNAAKVFHLIDVVLCLHQSHAQQFGNFTAIPLNPGHESQFSCTKEMLTMRSLPMPNTLCICVVADLQTLYLSIPCVSFNKYTS